jgi:hypothetical protein
MSSVPNSREDQRALFGLDVEVIGNGTTDPGSYQAERKVTFTDAETLPSEVVELDSVGQPLDDDEILSAVRDEVAARRRRQAQAGRHSPLRHRGSYLDVRVGDYLPEDFGPVTMENIENALVKAAELEAKRRRRSS